MQKKCHENLPQQVHIPQKSKSGKSTKQHQSKKKLIIQQIGIKKHWIQQSFT